MKIYISADMEGIATTSAFEDCTQSYPQYPYHCEQMTREVAAACTGALEAGATEITVNDAHGPGTNIDPKQLPDHCRIIRKWSGHPYIGVEGLKAGFDAVMFVGYHSGAAAGGNPLAHTISPKFRAVTINGLPASEFTIFGLCATCEGVPVVYLSGDRRLCEQEQAAMPGLVATAVKEGFGAATIALSSTAAVNRIRADVQKALKQDWTALRRPLPESFEIVIDFVHPHEAYKCRYYPGVRPVGESTLSFKSRDFFDVMCLFHFIIFL